VYNSSASRRYKSYDSIMVSEHSNISGWFETTFWITTWIPVFPAIVIVEYLLGLPLTTPVAPARSRSNINSARRGGFFLA